MTAKRGLEGAIHTIQAEVDAMLGAAKNAEEKSKNSQFGQLEARLADAENAAARGGKAAMAKLENKVHELEAELAATQARTGESAKAYQRAERKCKELAFTAGEDKKNQDRILTWPPSCSPRSRPTSSRSRRPRRSLPSTWPSSGRPSRSWRRSRSAPSLLPSSKPRWTSDLCQLKLEENLMKSGTLRQHTHTVKIQKLPRREVQTPDIKQCFPKPPGCRPWLFLSNQKRFSAAA